MSAAGSVFVFVAVIFARKLEEGNNRGAPPAGWSDVGRVGSREECLAYIEEVWTDMRPLSLRRAMGESV